MDIMYQIVNNIEQRDYIRMYPLWYKEINRHPERYQDLINEIEALKKQSPPTRLQKFGAPQSWLIVVSMPQTL